MKNIEEVYKKRIERVEAVCEKYKNYRQGYSPFKLGDTFIFDMKNRFAWCKLFKVINTCYMSIS